MSPPSGFSLRLLAMIIYKYAGKLIGQIAAHAWSLGRKW